MFNCDKCGICCQSLSGVALFRELDRGDGTCRYFDEATHLCSIYNDRPLLCRVDESYEAFFSDTMTREEYEQINYEACKQLKQSFAEKRTCKNDGKVLEEELSTLT